jgi:hypothetical protein
MWVSSKSVKNGGAVLAYSVSAQTNVAGSKAETSTLAFVPASVVRQVGFHRRRCISCQLVVELRQVYRRSVYTIAGYECFN